MVIYSVYLVFKYFLNRLIRLSCIASISGHRLYLQPGDGYDAKMICKKGGYEKYSQEYKKFHYIIHHLPLIIQSKKRIEFPLNTYIGMLYRILEYFTACR